MVTKDGLCFFGSSFVEVRFFLHVRTLWRKSMCREVASSTLSGRERGGFQLLSRSRWIIFEGSVKKKKKSLRPKFYIWDMSSDNRPLGFRAIKTS